MADDETKADLQQQFAANLARVGGILDLYSQVSGGKTGRPSVRESDILRAAVVLLHATLEDLLRGVAAWKYPNARPEVLAQVPLVGKREQNRPTHTLEDLAAHRGGTVDELIRVSVRAWLERSNFNNMGDVKRLLVDLDIVTKFDDPRSARDLASMTSRRHMIAHRLDRNESSGRGHHQARSLGRLQVDRWFKAVNDFGSALFSAV